jgi:periplasmic copper chaperone A
MPSASSDAMTTAMRLYRLVPTALLSLSALALAACGGDREKKAADETVRVEDAWCRTTPNGAQSGACYVTLTSATADRLLSVATPAAATTQIHEMAVENGVGRMRELENGLELPAGQAVTLQPGARHLMLLGLTQPLAEGTAVSLTLGFERAAPVAVTAQVRMTPPE